MKKKINRSKQATELRRKAEAKAGKNAAQMSENREPLSPEEIQQMLHELRVHQIELEMQNEELSRLQTEVELSRDDYRDLYDLAPVGYFTLSEKGLILQANLTGAALLGVDRGTLIKKPFSRFILMEDQDIFYLHFRQLLKTGTPQPCELRLQKKDGLIFWVRLDTITTWDAEGMKAYSTVLSDITEQKQTEELLHLNEEKYHSLFSEMSSGCALHEIICDNSGNPMDYITLEVNKAYELLLGVKSENVIGKRASEILSQAELQHWVNIFGPVALTGVVTHYEMYSAGNQKHFEGSAYCPESGKFVVTFFDITERKRAEQALAESEALHRITMESISDPVFITDDTGQFTFICASVQHTLSYSVEEIQNMGNISRLIGDGLPSSEELVVHGEIQNIERAIADKSGQNHHFLINMKRVSVKGGTILYTGHEITERKQAEEVIRLNEQRLSALLKLSQMSEASLREMADLVLAEAVKLTQSELGFIGFMNEDGTVMNIHAWSKEAMAECAVVDKPMYFPLAEAGLWAEAVRQRRAVIFNDYKTSHPHKKGYPIGHVALTRLLTIPVFDKEQIVAVVTVGNKGEDYDQVDIQQLALLTNGMWQIVQRREAEDALQQHNRQLETLNRVGTVFSSSLDLEQLLDAVLGEVRNLLGVSACLVWLVDPVSADLVRQQIVGAESQSEIVDNWQSGSGEQIAGATVTGGKSIIVPDMHAAAACQFGLFDDQPEPVFRSVLSIPLQARGNVIGALQAVDTVANRFTADDLIFLEALAGSAGIAIDNARLFEETNLGRQRLQSLSRRLVEAQENERRRVARELHDVIGQALTAVKISLQSAEHSLDAVTPDTGLNRELSGMVEIVEQTLQEVRRLSFDLRPSLLDDLGLIPALRWNLDRQARQAGFAAQFKGHLPARLSAHLEVACFRIVQEALTNVVRHAQARQVSVELQQIKSELQVIIRDDGAGFDVAQMLKKAAVEASLGLLGMQERAQLIGGQLEIESAPNYGTEIRLFVPLTAETKYNAGEELL